MTSAQSPSGTPWQAFYDRNFLPWDTRKVASHLSWYLTTPCVCSLRADSQINHQITTSGLVRLEGGHVWMVEGTPLRGPPQGPDYPVHEQQEAQPVSHPFTSLNPPEIGSQSCPKCSALRPNWQSGVSTALELGCGTGSCVIAMAEAGLHAVGVDLVPAAITAGWEAGERAGVRCHVEGVPTTTTITTVDGVVVSEVPVPADGTIPSKGKGSATFLCADVFTLPRPLSYTVAVQLAQATTAVATTTSTSTTTDDAGSTHTTTTSKTILTPVVAVSSASQASTATMADDAGNDITATTTNTSKAADVVKSAAASVPDADTLGPALFDFIYDCQSWHALRQVDEAAYVELLTKSTAPGGTLMILAASADPHPGRPFPPPSSSPTPKLGPPKVTREELLSAFNLPDWEWVWLQLTRFDDTEFYKETMPEPPLAFWGLLRRTTTDPQSTAAAETVEDGDWTLV